MVEAGKQWRSPVFAMSGAPAPAAPPPAPEFRYP